MARVRLGAVAYLNARPLVHDLDTRSDLFTIRFDPGATPEAIRELRDRTQTLARDLARRKAA